MSIFCYSVFKEQTTLKETILIAPSKLNRNFSSQRPTFVFFLLRKEVIHPHVPVGIPCYDLTPIISPTFDGSLLKG